MIENEIYMLVGPQGSGKTEIANSLVNKFNDIGVTRISQDEQGPKEHFNKYKFALEERCPKIIIDRINHTYIQREKYLKLAREAGYVITIIDITTDPTTCFNRIINRKGHQTMPFGDKDRALKALFTFYSEYQKPKPSEADNINDVTDFNPNFLDLSDELKDERYMIVGDIHGCFDEFVQLLIESKTHNIISVGDIIDKGPKIRETILFFKSNKKAHICMGNHEFKYLKYLVGNKVNTNALTETINQTKDLDKYELALFLMSMPKMIKINENYMFHAGINPVKPMERQNKFTLMYARKYHPETNSFEDVSGSKYWHEYINKHNPEHNTTHRYFGHHYHNNVCVAHNTYALDGHCVYGKELRAMVLPERKILSVKAKKQYKDASNSVSFIHGQLEQFENQVSMGYINKSEKDDLVIYKYSKKCVAEKAWNSITRKARGTIFNKKTGECLAKPYEKFFNLDEMPESQLENLPKDKNYKILDKLDGSLGILYWHNEEPKIATMGSFDSKQAIEANKILKEKGYYDKLMSNIYPFSRTLTLLFEIVYPENKIVCDYLDSRDLFLTGAIDRLTGYDYDIYGDELESFINYIGFPKAICYNDAKIEEIVRAKGTISKDKEGWIIRYSNGFRVKVKGDEYLKIHKLVSEMSPLAFWSKMSNGVLENNLLDEIPEEHKKEAILIKTNLEGKYKSIKNDLLSEIDGMIKHIGFGKMDNLEYRKKVGLYIKNNKPKQSSLFFPYLIRNNKTVDASIMKKIRPKGNEL